MREELSIETPTAYVYIEEGVLFVEMKEDADVRLEHVKENLAARKKLQQGKPMLVVGDVSKAWQFSKDAREFIASREVTDLNHALAIVTGSISTRLAANFFIRFNKPGKPTRMFTSREKALSWLKSL